MPEKLTPQTIIEQYGLKFDQKFLCNELSRINLIRIVKDPLTKWLPEIYFHRKIWHVYVLYEGCVLNKGVTAEPGRYPDLSVEQLKNEAENRTIPYTRFTLCSFYRNPYEFNQIQPCPVDPNLAEERQMMEAIFPESTLLVAIPKLRKLHLQYFHLSSFHGTQNF